MRTDGTEGKPLYDESGRAPRETADAARECGPVQREAGGSWVVLGHEEVVQAARDAQTFSSAVSRFLQVPNGLDGAEHRAFRAALDRFFSAERMARLEPEIRQIARDLVAQTLADGERDVDIVGDFGNRFAVRAMTRWLGWPADLEGRLLAWMDANREATRSGVLERTAAVAAEYDAIIESVLAPRRGADAPGADGAEQGRDTAGDAGARDVTGEVMAARVHPPDAPEGRHLTYAELVSLLRNWTAGDLGSIALSLGVILAGLTEQPSVAQRVREGASAAEVEAIVDEFLRIDDPFVANRRVATCPVELGGRRIEAGERVRLHWTAANRDPRTFPDVEAFDAEGNAADNLVWGTGPHVCPGRPLAMLELRVVVEEVLAAADLLDVTGGERTLAPNGGWSALTVRLRPRA